MKNKKRLILASTVLAFLLVASSVMGCQSGPRTKTPVKVVMATFFGSWMSNYAVIHNLVTSDTVEVTIEQSASYDTLMLAGGFPIGAMNTSSFAVATEKSSLAFKATSVYCALTGTDALKGTAVVYAKAGSAINSPPDLIGKKVGVPGLKTATASIFLGLLKSEYGIDESQLTLVDNAGPQLIEFLRKDDLDAILLLAEPSVQCYYNPDFKIVWNVDQAFQKKFGTYSPASLLVVQADFLKDNGDIAKAVYDLLKRSRDYGEAHMVELSQKYAAEFGGAAEFYQKAVRNHYSISFDPIDGKMQQSVLAIFGFVKDRGIITRLPSQSSVFEKW